MQPEKIFSSVYQDVYRLHYGVIFLVNKFATIQYSLKEFKNKRYYDSEYLRVLTEDAVIPVINKKCPAGTVLYNYFPVRLIDKSQWTYELKLSSGCCYGTAKNILELTEEIDKIVLSYEYGISTNEEDIE